MQQFYLSRSVFACVEGDYLAFLDLKKDRYLCIPRDNFHGVEESIEGLSAVVGDPTDPREERGDGAESLIREMANMHLITKDKAQGKAFSVTRVPEAQRSIMDQTFPGNHMAISDLSWFLMAAFSAAIQLKTCSLSVIVNRILRRKVRSRSGIASLQFQHRKDYCIDELGTFHSLRPRFPRDYLCLFDSLAMLEFLARRKAYPSWIFGIQLGPFQAHCWLQFDDVVLNDSVEHVRRYTPIMVV